MLRSGCAPVPPPPPLPLPPFSPSPPSPIAPARSVPFLLFWTEAAVGCWLGTGFTDVVMIIGLLRPTDTDCWWGTDASAWRASRPEVGGAPAVLGGGRCVGADAIGAVGTDAVVVDCDDDDGVVVDFARLMLAFEGRGAIRAAWRVKRVGFSGWGDGWGCRCCCCCCCCCWCCSGCNGMFSFPRGELGVCLGSAGGTSASGRRRLRRGSGSAGTGSGGIEL